MEKESVYLDKIDNICKYILDLEQTNPQERVENSGNVEISKIHKQVFLLSILFGEEQNMTSVTKNFDININANANKSLNALSFIIVCKALTDGNGDWIFCVNLKNSLLALGCKVLLYFHGGANNENQHKANDLINSGLIDKNEYVGNTFYLKEKLKNIDGDTFVINFCPDNNDTSITTLRSLFIKNNRIIAINEGGYMSFSKSSSNDICCDNMFFGTGFLGLGISINPHIEEILKIPSKNEDYYVAYWKIHDAKDLITFCLGLKTLKEKNQSFNIYVGKDSFENVRTYLKLFKQIEKMLKVLDLSEEDINEFIKDESASLIKDNFELKELLTKSVQKIKEVEFSVKLKFRDDYSFTCTKTNIMLEFEDSTIFNVQPFEGKTNLEFLQFIYDGQDVFGCTGDQSLYECVLLRKFPFYQNPKHKAKLINEYFFLLRDCTQSKDIYEHDKKQPVIEDVIFQTKKLRKYYEGFYLKNKDHLISFLRKYQDIAKNILTYFNYLKSDVKYLQNLINASKE
jgi:hypothetical protein